MSITWRELKEKIEEIPKEDLDTQAKAYDKQGGFMDLYTVEDIENRGGKPTQEEIEDGRDPDDDASEFVLALL